MFFGDFELEGDQKHKKMVPRASPEASHNLHLKEYINLFKREETSMKVLHSATEEQFWQVGVRTLGQIIRKVNAATLTQDGGGGEGRWEVAQHVGQGQACAQGEDGQDKGQAATQGHGAGEDAGQGPG